MGKKDKSKLGIKTSRYFTKECSNCGYEYPNWFVSCPKCGTSWNETSNKKETSIKKNVKIVVKITEEDFKEPIKNVKIIFSGDQGSSWYKINMDFKSDYYMAEILEVPEGANIIYYIEVELISGEKIIENNEGQFFIYHVGGTEREKQHPPQQTAVHAPTEPVPEETSKSPERTPSAPNEYFKPSETISPNEPSKEPMEFSKGATEYREEPQKETSSQSSPTFTIFGKPQTEKETNLKMCPKCHSKIKMMWSVCPICGKDLKKE